MLGSSDAHNQAHPENLYTPLGMFSNGRVSGIPKVEYGAFNTFTFLVTPSKVAMLLFRVAEVLRILPKSGTSALGVSALPTSEI